jgi:hypothetical protein
MDYSSQADYTTDEPANINPNNANFVNGVATNNMDCRMAG